jgi:hypothetical protein
MVVPGAPLMISALRTSFCGTGAISDGSLVAVGVGGVASVERARATNEGRSRAGLARASEQARRRDIGLKRKRVSLRSHLRQHYIQFWYTILTVSGASIKQR